METEYTIYLLKFVFFTIGLGVISIICLFTYQHYRDKRKERDLKFEVMLWNLDTIVHSWPVDEKSMNKILGYFGQIGALKHPNKEKVEVLWIEYLNKYKVLSAEIMSEEENDPSQIFGEKYSKEHIAKKAHTVYEKMKPIVEPVMK